MGAATGKLLGQSGMRVILADIKQDKADEVARDITEKGGRAESFFLDVADDNCCNELSQKIKNIYGGLDVLINNAGTDTTLPFKELPMEEFDRIMDVNLRGPILLSKLFLEELEKSKGQIINVASTASERAWPNATAYHASKWGLIGFSRGLYTEARDSDIKVTALIPGGMKTAHLLERFPDIDQTKLQDAENVASVIKFLLTQPRNTIIPEILVLPLLETSWP